MREGVLTGTGAKILESLPLGRDRPVLGYSGSIAICVLAVLMRFAANDALPVGYPYVGFFPAVILATFLFGVGPGILAAVLCGAAAWHFFIPPFQAFKMSAGVVLAMGMYSIVAATNIAVLAWMQGANGRLRLEHERNRQLAERSDLLFRELQHRVSNNLQVVGGLLALQKREVSDPQARLAIDEASRRLGLIGRIHRQLYSPTGAELRLTAFLNQLATDLIDTTGKQGISCTVEANDDLPLQPDAAVPIALIIAESITNAIEHGFADREEGAIVIRVAARGELIELSVSNDGADLPDGFDLTRSESLGLRLAQMLAEQLQGDFSLSTGAGTTAMLRMPR